MSIKNLITFLFVLLFSQTAIYAKDAVTEISISEFKKFSLDDLSDQTGVIVLAQEFLSDSFKKDSKAKEIPTTLANQFDENSKLLIHHAFLKIPKDYNSFVKKALKNKSSIEKNILYNSVLKVDVDTFAPCTTLNGTMISDMNLPKFLSIFDYPEKLLCDVAVTNSGTGKKYLRPELLSKLSADLKDEDVHYVNLNLTNCNMIFKALSQNIYFIKAKDGKTLIVFDNYSLVKVSTLDKLDKVKFFMGSPVKFVNEQVKKNMSGLLTFINSQTN